MDALIDLFLARYIYAFVLVLLAIGLTGVLLKADLLKKLIGLTIFSTAIYLFFIEGSVQDDATAPVIDARGSDPSLYVDPLPHLLILTAIVVGVGVIGVGLALLVRIHRAYGTLDEDVIAARILAPNSTGAPDTSTSSPDPSAGSDGTRAPDDRPTGGHDGDEV